LAFQTRKFTLVKLVLLAVFGSVAIPGCCVSYESDVNKICNLSETCPKETGLFPSQGRDNLIDECLSTKLYTSEGRALWKTMNDGKPEWTRSALLRDAANEVGLKSCPWADGLVSKLDVPPAPAVCKPLPDSYDSSIAVFLFANSITVGDRLDTLSLPAHAELVANGLGEDVLSKDDPLDIVPIHEALSKDIQIWKSVAKAKNLPGLPLKVWIWEIGAVNPLPPKLREQLLHTIHKAGVQDVQQIFIKPDKSFCSAPMR
jgi:hypothetical protein